jgi:hypothetical protein
MELQTIIRKRIDIFLPVIHHETNYFKIKMFPQNISHFSHIKNKISLVVCVPIKYNECFFQNFISRNFLFATIYFY